MNDKFKSKEKNNQQRIVLFVIVLLSLHGVLQYYVDFGIISNIFLYVNYVIAFSFPVILSVKNNFNINSYRIAYIFSFLISFLISFLFLYKDFGVVVFSMAVYFQLITAYYSNKITLVQWLNIFKVIAIIAISTSVYLLIVSPIDFSKVVRRGYTWGKLFYFAVLYWAVIPFVLLSFLKKKYRLLSITYWIFAVVVNSLFLKRFIIVDTIMLVTVLFLMNSKKSRTIFLIIPVFLGVIFFSNYKNDNVKSVYVASSARMDEASEEGGNNARVQESVSYFIDNNILEIIMGKGFASVHRGLGKDAFALHMGWTNFIFKGGVILFLIVLRPYFRVISFFNKIKNLPVKIQFSFWFLVIYFFRLFYINMFSLTPELILFFYCIFNVMDFNYNKKHIVR